MYVGLTVPKVYVAHGWMNLCMYVCVYVGLSVAKVYGAHWRMDLCMYICMYVMYICGSYCS